MFHCLSNCRLVVLLLTLVCASSYAASSESTISAEKILAQKDLQDDKDCSKTRSNNDCTDSNHQTLVVTSNKSTFAGLNPTTEATSIVEVSKLIKIPQNLTQILSSTLGVAENSQPGLYQVISIRGVSRQRILNFVDGIRISGDRRAGVSASFIDPLLLSSVSVIRGPISTHFGSGAIGGVTQMQFDDSPGMELVSGYNQVGNEKFNSFKFSQDDLTAAIVHRNANNSTDINHNPLNTHFQQTAGYLEKSWSFGENTVKSWIYSSKGKDNGRSNSRYPQQIVNLPNENHSLFKTSITSPLLWSFDFYLHHQDIETSTLKPEQSFNLTTARSLDWGAKWQKAWEQVDHSQLLGVEYFGRRNVDIKERNLDLLNNLTSTSNTLKKGQLDQIALYFTSRSQLNDFRFQYGGRYTTEESNAYQVDKKTNNALTGFVGAAYELSDNLEINANLGSGFRFASLSERFFSGTTARGTITGNPDLKSEKATTFDLGFSWQQSNLHAKANYFFSDFSDYVERIETVPDGLTYINLDNGKIEGVEAEFDWQLNQQFELILNTTLMQGRNDLDQFLADIPSDRLNLILRYSTHKWQSNLHWQHRRSKKDPGNGELATNSSNILSVNFSYQLNSKWRLNLSADNLFDQSYVSSADDLSTLNAGRNFGVMVRWNQD